NELSKLFLRKHAHVVFSCLLMSITRLAWFRSLHNLFYTLKGYVRMLLLFSDSRFVITGDTIKLAKSDFNKKKIRATLFNKTLKYLYHQSLYGSLKEGNTIKEYDIHQFRNFFAMSDSYTAPNGSSVDIYRRLRISSSMFHRFKKMDKNRIGTVAEMLQSVNDRSKEDMEKLEAQRELEKKAPPGLFFDKEAFRSASVQTKLWTDDYIDSLLIFYRLNELSIRYRTLYSDKNDKHQSNRNKHRTKNYRGQKGVRK
ncbi:hypothetical protein, partial [Marinicrinis lubricantis]